MLKIKEFKVLLGEMKYYFIPNEVSLSFMVYIKLLINVYFATFLVK